MQIKVLKLNENAIIPARATEGAAGADLYALNEQTVAPGETVMFATGIAIQIPLGFVGLIFARSGISIRNGLAPANKVGVIDSDYRGEIRVALLNHSQTAYTVKTGERIAQIVIVPCVDADFCISETLDSTARADGGFGSTGK